VLLRLHELRLRLLQPLVGQHQVVVGAPQFGGAPLDQHLQARAACMACHVLQMARHPAAHQRDEQRDDQGAGRGGRQDRRRLPEAVVQRQQHGGGRKRQAGAGDHDRGQQPQAEPVGSDRQ
jgi:hypothetical protein